MIGILPDDIIESIGYYLSRRDIFIIILLNKGIRDTICMAKCYTDLLDVYVAVFNKKRMTKTTQLFDTMIIHDDLDRLIEYSSGITTPGCTFIKVRRVRLGDTFTLQTGYMQDIDIDPMLCKTNTRESVYKYKCISLKTWNTLVRNFYTVLPLNNTRSCTDIYIPYSIAYGAKKISTHVCKPLIYSSDIYF
jgi:hypothetical protein